MSKPQKPTTIRLGELDQPIRKIAEKKDWSKHKTMKMLLAYAVEKKKFSL